MTVNGVNGNSVPAGQMGMKQADDAVSKNLQKQIAELQKQLQELSANKELSPEDKMKKRQEIQKQITDLNNQLRQHQIEQRREQQVQKSSKEDGLSGGEKKDSDKDGNQNAGMSQAGMQAMISAETSLKEAKVQGNVASRLEGMARTMRSEIKLDAGRGGNVEKKQEALAEIEKKAEAAKNSQISTLGKANKKWKETAAKEIENEKSQKTEKEKQIEEKEKQEQEEVRNYISVDIRL